MEEIRDIIIRKDEKYTLYMDIFRPDNPAKKAPCLMWIHGGAWCMHELTRTYIPEQYKMWVEAGYVVASCEYRLSDEAVWPAQIEDCRYDLEYLMENADKYGIDKDNIFVWGESAGGHLASFIANDGKVKGGCIWYPPVYFDVLREDRPEYGWCRDLIGTDDFNTREKLDSISPLFTVSEKSSPCLVMHGMTDDLVDISMSEMLVEALKQYQNDVTFIKVPGQGHGFFNGDEYYKLVLDWMNARIS